MKGFVGKAGSEPCGHDQLLPQPTLEKASLFHFPRKLSHRGSTRLMIEQAVSELCVGIQNILEF